MENNEIQRIIGISFFDVNQEEYEKCHEKIDLMSHAIDCMHMAEYNAKVIIDENGYKDDANIMLAYISEAVKMRHKFLHDVKINNDSNFTDNIHTYFDDMIGIDNTNV